MHRGAALAYMQNMEDKTAIREEPEPTAIARIELESGIRISIQPANLPLTIGRATDCDICIPSGTVSRHHCELYLVNGVLCLKDTSSNGTMIGERLVKRGSISIRGITSVNFAGDVGIRIIPAIARRPKVREDRRRNERRQGDRRQKVIIVSFDRRKPGNDRRTIDRRK